MRLEQLLQLVAFLRHEQNTYNERNSMKITRKQLRRIIREATLGQPDVYEELIFNAEDLYNMIMDTGQPAEAWFDGVRNVRDFRKYISGMVDEARRGGMSMKEINSVVSKAWKTETDARRRRRFHSFLD